MKHLLTTALLCGVSVLAAQAQNVVITDKDGIPHKFHADYVQEITFEEIKSAEGFDFKFTDLTVNPYGQQNIGLTFTCDEASIGLDIYQGKALYLQPGTYTVDGSCADWTIDPGYSSFRINGEEKKLKSGNMTIAADGETYTFDMNFTFDSGETMKGSYTGTLNSFGPSVNFDFTECGYVTVNDPLPNAFYYRFNDASWKTESTIEIYSAGDAPAPGTYTFSNSTENGNATSSIALYSPYNENTYFKEGTVTISGEGDNTVVEIEGTLEIGIRMTAKFSGKLPERK